MIFFMLSLISFFQEEPDNYIFSFYKIDNKVDIIINDSLVYTSGEINSNPDIEGLLTIDITKYLTNQKDEVIVQLYNGFEPYTEDQKDKHWEIEYSIYKNDQQIELMWNEGDDYQSGLVFEEKYSF